MSITFEPEQARELLAAYALGAVSGDEAAQVEALLARDPGARRELAGYEAATLSLHAPDGPGPDVWASIMETIDEQQERSGVVIPIAPARARRAPRRSATRVLIAATAAAALIAAAAWGVSTADRSLPAAPASDVSRAAAVAEGTPGARHVSVVTPDGDTVNLVVLPDGHGFVLDGVLPLAPDGAQYLLVGLRDGERVLLGVLGSVIEPTAFQVPDGVDQLVIELAGTERGSLQIGSAALPPAPTGESAGAPVNGGAPAVAPDAPSPSSAPSAGGAPPSLSLPSITLPNLGLPLF